MNCEGLRVALYREVWSRFHDEEDVRLNDFLVYEVPMGQTSEVYAQWVSRQGTHVTKAPMEDHRGVRLDAMPADGLAGWYAGKLGEDYRGKQATNARKAK